MGQHADCEELTPAASLRLCTALGRLAAPGGIRLFPRGAGGPDTGTNRRMMDVLERRLSGLAPQCCAPELAAIDEYYLTRLCCEETQRRLVVRMAELQIGLRENSKQYLPVMVRLEEAVRRELSDLFRFTLPRTVRNYLEQLKVLGLKETSPWVLGDFS